MAMYESTNRGVMTNSRTPTPHFPSQAHNSRPHVCFCPLSRFKWMTKSYVCMYVRCHWTRVLGLCSCRMALTYRSDRQCMRFQVMVDTCFGAARYCMRRMYVKVSSSWHFHTNSQKQPDLILLMLILKREAECSSESVAYMVDKTTWRHNPEYQNMNTHHCKNFNLKTVIQQEGFQNSLLLDITKAVLKTL
jgi:hypothetical protein